jgi:hypothetical protein
MLIVLALQPDFLAGIKRIPFLSLAILIHLASKAVFK